MIGTPVMDDNVNLLVLHHGQFEVQGVQREPTHSASGAGRVRQLRPQYAARTRLEYLDVSVSRNFLFTERMKLQFRAEAFNLTNTEGVRIAELERERRVAWRDYIARGGSADHAVCAEVQFLTEPRPPGVTMGLRPTKGDEYAENQELAGGNGRPRSVRKVGQAFPPANSCVFNRAHPRRQHALRSRAVGGSEARALSQLARPPGCPTPSRIRRSSRRS